MGTKISAPKGFRLAKVGEKRPPGYIAFKYGTWQAGVYAGKPVEDFAVPIAFPVKTKPAKPAPKAKWAPIPATTKQTKTELIALANKLGAENAQLKNQLAKGKSK